MIKDHKQFNLFDKKLIEKVVLKPPFTAPGVMRNEACFIYAVQGKAQAIGAVDSVNFSSEEAVVMKCGNYLNRWLEEREGEQCEAIAIHFYPEVLKKVYEKELPGFLSDVQSENSSSLEKIKSSQLLRNYIHGLQFYFENPNLVSEELLRIKLKELILLLAKTDNSEAIRSLISSLFTPTVYNLKEFVESQILHNLSLQEMAILYGTSLSSFKREFAKAYGCSPAKYFKRRKLERAAQLLTHGDDRISEVAFACGFNEVAHFSRSFQEQYGLTPTQYRKSKYWTDGIGNSPLGQIQRLVLKQGVDRSDK